MCRMNDMGPEEASATILWEQPGFRIAYKIWLASWIVSLCVSLVAPTAHSNLLAAIVFGVALLWGMWHWGRKPGAFSPKWFLLVLTGGGALGAIQLAITNSPLRLIPGALSLLAFIILVRGWPRRDTYAPTVKPD